MQNLFMRSYSSSLMLRWYQSNLKPFESPMLFLFTGWSFGKVFTFQVNLPRYLFFLGGPVHISVCIRVHKSWQIFAKMNFAQSSPLCLSTLALIVAKFDNRKWQTSFVKLDLLLLFSSQHFLFKPQQHKSLQLDCNLKFMFHFKRTMKIMYY